MTDDAYTRPAAQGGHGYKRGPINNHDVGPFGPCAIGFCGLCGANARRSTAIRGLFDCPRCTNYWHDARVGTQTRSFEDFFAPA